MRGDISLRCNRVDYFPVVGLVGISVVPASYVDC